jgi:hypothetical protein
VPRPIRPTWMGRDEAAGVSAEALCGFMKGLW